MFISLSQWKMIKVFNGVDPIEPKNLAKSFKHLNNLNYNKTLETLNKKNIVNYFWIGSGYSEYSSYNLTPIGMKVAKRGFLK